MKASSIEEIQKYLTSLKIENNIVEAVEINGRKPYSRVIEFKIENNVYFIEWWINQSYLKLENGFSKPNLPFKYINVNANSPTRIHKNELCFYDVVNENKNQFIYSEIPFGCFKIPFN